ncbi:SRPBCC family protein [Hyphomonas sp.]|jgi:carbon monoxide dehydrogenase subunit G|uniref:SRPBCC family protein n=1 Tax=Hyphomonas sp. TaxID=87 RepID=UPI0033428114
MQIKNNFEVPLGNEETWVVLQDIPLVAPCMPSAEYLGMTDDGLTHKIRISVKLGPVALVFAGTAKIDELDTAQKRALVKAQGSDTKGRGGASAAITFTLTPTDTGTRVDVVTDVALSGSVAQYGRGAGIIQGVSTQLVNQFASNLRSLILKDSPPAEASKPISGATLIGKAMWSGVRDKFRRNEGESDVGKP